MLRKNRQSRKDQRYRDAVARNEKHRQRYKKDADMKVGLRKADWNQEK